MFNFFKQIFIKENEYSDFQVLKAKVCESETLYIPPSSIEEEYVELNRITTLEDFVGNKNATERLQLTINAHAIKGGKFPNVLFYGNAGCGKTTLAEITAHLVGVPLIKATGSSFNNQLDLVKFMMVNSVNESAAIFIDEIHGITKGKGLSDDIWLPFFEENKLYHSCNSKKFVHNNYRHIVGNSPLILNPNTFWIGATTDPGLLTEALRRRFQVTIALEPYTKNDMQQIVKIYCDKEAIKITNQALKILVNRSRMTPAFLIHHILRQTIDCAIIRSHTTNAITVRKCDVLKACEIVGVNSGGLLRDDLNTLKCLEKTPQGLGAKTLASMINCNLTTMENMILPFLQQNGWVMTGNRRCITSKGLQYLNTLRRTKNGKAREV